MKPVVPVLLLASLSCSAPPVERFEVNGQPIHPACFYELLGWISDAQPVIVAVDVEGTARSNRYSQGIITKDQNGWAWEHSDHLGPGSFRYWWLGSTRRGSHAVLASWSGGGSGIVYSVVFVKLERINDRWILTRLGDVPLGDRTEDQATVEGDDLVIRSRDGSERKSPIPGPW